MYAFKKYMHKKIEFMYKYITLCLQVRVTYHEHFKIRHWSYYEGEKHEKD